MSAEIERDPLRVIDEEADEVAPDDLGEQDLDFGLHLCKAGLDIGLDRAHVTSLIQQKSGLFARFPEWPHGREKLCN